MFLQAVVLAVLVTAIVPSRALAQGGPPLITDDPDTPGPGYWEINIAALVDKTLGSRRVETPRVDLNYGIGRRIQLKLEMPWVIIEREAQQAETGLGDATLGLKWRFLGSEGETIAWSIYPQLEFNTARSSVTRHIEDDGYQLLLPTEITLQIGRLEINGEVGRNVAEYGSDHWIFGVSTEGHVLPRLELLGELHGDRVIDEASEVIAVGGGRLKLTSKIILLMAAGHTVHTLRDEGPRTYIYAGLQLNLPRQFPFEAGAQLATGYNRRPVQK